MESKLACPLQKGQRKVWSLISAHLKRSCIKNSRWKKETGREFAEKFLPFLLQLSDSYDPL